MLGILQIDHVLMAVADLAEVARLMEARHGLLAVGGGRHPGWGTENRIVPLGGAYLELIAVADEKQAAARQFGSWVSAASPGQPRCWAGRFAPATSMTWQPGTGSNLSAGRGACLAASSCAGA